MTPLRRQMIEAMRQRGFSVRTHESYLDAVARLARFYRRSPAELSVEELQGYFNHLVQDRELAPATCRLYLNAVRFLYLQVLKWPSFDLQLVVPKRPQRIPELLTREEVGRILGACANAKHRLLLEVCYACGLRVSELVSLRSRDIDTERNLLRVEQGKGAKDRMVILSPRLQERLVLFARHHGSEWLFPSERENHTHIDVSTAQKVFTRAKAHSGVMRIGGIHGLRHAYASHQIEGGVPLHQLQKLLGHNDLRTTERYLHWLPGRTSGTNHVDLLAGMGVGHE